MAETECILMPHAVSPHLSQIYTGFYLLAKAGMIHLRQILIKDKCFDFRKSQHLREVRLTHLRVVINDSITVHYDTHDSWEIDEKDLEATDFYFKRSYDSSRVNSLGRHRQKVFPLGLNYPVYPDGLDQLGFIRSIKSARGWKKLTEAFRSLYIFKKIFFISSVDDMEAPPVYDASPKILFMTGVWDPYDDLDRSQEKIGERIQINETRADCIRKLRNAFKNRFYGGFIHSKYALKNFNDCLLPENTLLKKKNYIRLLKTFPIGVATTGLHGSTGWKFAEYIAFSKAILTERLNYEVPGRFEVSKNYLEFNSVEECVEKIDRLISDSKLRKSMMENNWKYYQTYLRPDALVWNTLRLAQSGHRPGWARMNENTGCCRHNALV